MSTDMSNFPKSASQDSSPRTKNEARKATGPHDIRCIRYMLITKIVHRYVELPWKLSWFRRRRNVRVVPEDCTGTYRSES